MNCYQILGIQSSATEEEIKKAYRKLAHLHHPDKGGDAKKFSQVNQAYKDALDNLKNKSPFKVWDTPKTNDYWRGAPMREQSDPFEDFNRAWKEAMAGFAAEQNKQMNEAIRRKQEAMEAERVKRRENLRRMMRESGVDPRMFGGL